MGTILPTAIVVTPENCPVGGAVIYRPMRERWYRGVIEVAPWQLGDGTWVTHLHHLEADYSNSGAGFGARVRAADLNHLRLYQCTVAVDGHFCLKPAGTHQRDGAPICVDCLVAMYQSPGWDGRLNLDSQFNLAHRSEPLCPYCFTEQDAAWELGSGGEEVDDTSCEACERDFQYERYVTVTYTTRHLEKRRDG